MTAKAQQGLGTTRLYAETTAATLQRRFDRLTAPSAHMLVADIRQRRGDEAALIAADLLGRRVEPATTNFSIGFDGSPRP